MSVILSHGLVLGSDDGSGVTSTSAPMIGWDNRVQREDISATSEEELHPATNMGNPSTSEYWRAANTDTQYITILLSGEDQVIDYIGIARHNLGSSMATITLEYSESDVDDVWDIALGPFMVGDDSVIFGRMVPVPASRVRLKIEGAQVPPRLAVLSVGKSLLLQRNIYVGHTPITYGRKTRLSSGVSESGQFLGRIILSNSHNSGISLRNITPSWYREYMDPFIASTSELPFFFAWRPDDYPLEVGYCWVAGEVPQPTNQLNNGMMEISLSFNGIVRKNTNLIILDPMEE